MASLLATQQRRIGLILALATAAAISAEIFLRMAWGLGHPLLVRADPEVGYYFKAGQDITRFGNRVMINQYHQRNPDIAFTNDGRTWRVLMVGDSVTFGGTLLDQSETIPELLQSRIQESRPLQILNASAGSWGLGNALAYLEKFGTFESQLVILQIGSHDLLQAKSDSSSVGRHPSKPDRMPWCALSELVGRYLWPRLHPPPVPVKARELAKEDQERLFNLNMADLKKILRLAGAAHAEILVLHTPDRDEVVPDPHGAVERWCESYRERFLGLCAENGVEAINLPARWQRQPETAAWFRDGVHLTARGNEEVARCLAEKLNALSMP